MTPLLAALALAYTFPARPVLDEVERGRVVARTVAKNDLELRSGVFAGSGRLLGIDRVLDPFEHEIGWWNEGFRKIPVEYVIELEPKLLSRWLGYLAERELWSEGELENRWNEVGRVVLGKRYFVVVLSAFPTKDKLGIGDDSHQSPEETRDVIFAIDSSMGRTEPQAAMISFQRAGGRGDLEDVPWWSMTPLGDVLTSKFQGEYAPKRFSLGDYYRAWWLVWTDSDLGEGPVTLKIASKRKIRSTTFKN